MTTIPMSLVERGIRKKNELFLQHHKKGMESIEEKKITDAIM
jgi:hypothetical protein